MEIYQQLILDLRHDKVADSHFKKVMVNKIMQKQFPDRDRTIVEIENWKDEKPFKVRIDSKPLHCNSCGDNHSYYVIYNLRLLPNFGWRLCARCLPQEARDMLENNYWSYVKI